MALEICPGLAIGSCCDQVEFCDATCLVNFASPFSCCNGYGVDGNTEVYEVNRTAFHWVFPDGSRFQNVDVDFVPSTPARNVFIVVSGTEGGIAVKVDGVTIGMAMFTTTLYAMVADLMVSINGQSAASGWMATFDATDLSVTLYSTCTGDDQNNKIVDVWVGGDLQVTQVSQITNSGRGEKTSCFTWTLDDLYESGLCPNFYPKWPDGVYSLTYILYDDTDEEITRRTAQFFFDCNVRNCFKNLLLKLAHDCSCKDDDTALKIADIRNKIDAAGIMFSQGDYEHANDTIQEAARMCNDFCIDC